MNVRTAARRSRLAVALLACAAGPLVAQEGSGNRYFGVGAAQIDHSADEGGIAFDDAVAGISVYGGLQLRERIALEGSLTSLPSVSSGEMPGSGVARLRIDSEIHELVVRGVFSLYLGDGFPRAARWTLFGTAGAFAAAEKRRVAELTASTVTRKRIDDSGFALGVGVLYDLPRLRLRATAEQRDGRHIDQIAIGIATEFRF